MSPASLWGINLKDYSSIKNYYGKFIVTEWGHVLLKLVPKSFWDQFPFFHVDILKEAQDFHSNVNPSTQVQGGGHIQMNFLEDFTEVELFGKSTVFGPFNKDWINKDQLEKEIRSQFDLRAEVPVLINLQS